MSSKKTLNIQIKAKAFFIFLVIFIGVAWIVSMAAAPIAQATKSDPGQVHLWAEKLYTGGFIVLAVWLGISTLIVPILAGGFFVIAASLAWHLYRKFKG